MKEQLKRLGLKKVDLAMRLGVNAKTVWDWKGSPPQYAQAYLDLLERNQVLSERLLAASDMVKRLSQELRQS